MSATSSSAATPTTKCPYAILTACSQSHAFEERRFTVPCCEEDALKIGRSMARFKPNNDNAIFDCKVLSRNHAILWYEEGAFFLKDTKSSNGTFVNNERLSKSAEESSPRQIFSGDILQFGVDIIESANKVIHGCIVAMVRLFDIKGEEVCAPEMSTNLLSTSSSSSLSIKDHGQFGSVITSVPSIPLINSYQMFQLHQYIREASHREHMLQQKLEVLENILSSTQEATQSSWQALINEDRLLSRIEMLESQLALYSKNISNDKIKEDMNQLLNDKNKFELLAKDSLRRSIEEKNEALQRLADVERSLINTEEEAALIRNKAEDLEHELENALSMNNNLNEAISLLQRQIKSMEIKQQQQQQQLASQENAVTTTEEREGEFKEEVVKTSTDQQSDTADSEHPLFNSEIQTLRSKLNNLVDENATLKAQLAQLGRDGGEIKTEQVISPATHDPNSIPSTSCQSVDKTADDSNQLSSSLQTRDDLETPVLLLLVLPFFAFFFICVRIGARIALLRPKRD